MASVRLHSSVPLHGAPHPVQHAGDIGIDSGQPRGGAADSPADGSRQSLLTPLTTDQRTATVTLAGVPARVTRTQHRLRDGVALASVT